MNFETFAQNVREWAESRALVAPDNYGPQISKLDEEVQEFIDSVYGKIQPEINKEWADVLVVWLIVGMIHNVNFSEAWTATWDKIKDRKGKTVNGQFVKEV
jgi:uncharacterized protein YabN with tetrapyrrole methylase and pyrophosphatase domain